MFYCCGITEKGKMPHNEDAMLINGSVMDEGKAEATITGPFIAAVSDGVSGENSGDVASKMCLSLINSIKYSKKVNLREKLKEIHYKMTASGIEKEETVNMQSTFCGIAVDEHENVTIVNVGDSRMYRFRGGQLKQVSRDQSLVQLLYEEGSITREEKRTHIHRNVIFPVMGNIHSEPTIEIEPLGGGMRYGDILLLCTDGLSDYLTPVDMEEILELPKSLMKRLELMIETALERECTDNITVAAAVYCG